MKNRLVHLAVKCIIIIIITIIKVIELVLDNWDGGEHPIHVHGRRFYVMARGADKSGPFSNSTQVLNEVDPILRDTVTVSAMSYIGMFTTIYYTTLSDTTLHYITRHFLLDGKTP